MKRTLTFFAVFFIASFAKTFAQGVVTDIDGNVYNTVTIGNQTWMQENLRVAHYLNGDSITQITDSATWANIYNSNLTTAAWCDYNNNAANDSLDGKLYNWYALTDPRHACPFGWHVPDSLDFMNLVNYLGGQDTAGGFLKAAGAGVWAAPNTGATNSTGFSAVGAGIRESKGHFTGIDSTTLLYSSSPNGPGQSYDWGLNYNNSWMQQNYNGNGDGKSCRCLQGFPAAIPKLGGYLNDIRIYPNPSSGNFTAKITAAQELNAAFEIFDVVGRRIENFNYQLHPGSNEYNFNIQAKGIYFMRISGSGDSNTVKIVIE